MGSIGKRGWAGAAIGAAMLAGVALPEAQAADVKFSGYVDAGIMGNLTGSTAGTNFGRLFDDRANRLQLNQATLLISKPLDPDAKGYDWGFNFMPMYGADARYTHVLGVFDRSSNSRNQFTFIELDALVHLPWITAGGIDAKIGIFPSSLSAETTVPSTNPFYSHSYIFNFGITVAHTGLLTATHINPMIDLWLGVDTGNQTSWFKGDNNDAAAGTAGLGLNLMDGNLTVLWLNHFGPENPTGTRNLRGRLVDNSMRVESTITTVLKWNEDWTFTTDLNVAHDAGFDASAYGIAQYVSYAINDMFTLQLRGEVWRDNKGFFAAAYPGSLDPLNVLAGRPNGSLALFPSPATYGEITVGVNIKPAAMMGLPERFSTLMLRPEIRWDTTLNNVRPFDNGRKKQQVTIGTDLVVPF